jgi:hypothetical protein
VANVAADTAYMLTTHSVEQGGIAHVMNGKQVTVRNCATRPAEESFHPPGIGR